MKTWVIALISLLILSSCLWNSENSPRVEILNNNQENIEKAPKEDLGTSISNEKVEPSHEENSTSIWSWSSLDTEVSTSEEDSETKLDVVSQFWDGKNVSMKENLVWKLIKINGTIHAWLEKLEKTPISFWYSTPTKFEEIGSTQSDENSFYYITFTIEESSKKDNGLYYIDVSSNKTFARLYFVDSDFKVEEFLEKNTPEIENYYFLGMTDYRGAIATWGDINMKSE